MLHKSYVRECSRTTCSNASSGRCLAARELRSLSIWVVLAGLVLVPAGCLKKGQQRRFELKGKVMAVDAKSHQVTIAHDAIPNYMPAMTMPYQLKDDLAMRVVKPGDQIDATLVVDGKHSWLQDAVVTEQNVDTSPAAAKIAIHIPEAGEQVPDFPLVNQDGKKISLDDFKGGPLVVTFIYTRCPLPDYCPLMSSNFAELDGALRKEPQLYSKTHLLSVTIDPKYDTPEVLRKYGSVYVRQAGDTNFDHWQFATGSAEQIKSITKFFGLESWEQNGQITHSLSTTVIGADGKVVKLYIGNHWKPAEVLAEIPR